MTQHFLGATRLSEGYMPGFGNHFSTEAVAGALPIGRNSPQKAAYGLYAEQLSGSAFTAPRNENRRTWVYRLRPSAAQGRFHRYEGAGKWLSAPFDSGWASPNRMRWDPPGYPEASADFIDGMITYGGNGDVGTGVGSGIHTYVATASMVDRAFINADGELLIVPQDGALRIVTELGVLDVAPLHIAVIPRGLRFKVVLPNGRARGYVCENYGAPFRLPELGPIGSNCLANVRDFETPIAWYEDEDRPTELVQKFQGRFWTTTLDHSPFDVAGWHGNLAPCRYDLRRYNAIGTISFDHPDPSIYTVMTSPSESLGTANCDFVIFPPRWMVAEDTFRPPWYHRNVMSEFMGLIHGQYDAKEGGFLPGGASLHNQMNSHGPDRASYDKAVAAELAPHRIEDTMAFMFESRWPVRTSQWAVETELVQSEYDDVWAGFEKAKLPK